MVLLTKQESINFEYKCHETTTHFDGFEFRYMIPLINGLWTRLRGYDKDTSQMYSECISQMYSADNWLPGTQQNTPAQQEYEMHIRSVHGSLQQNVLAVVF